MNLVARLRQRHLDDLGHRHRRGREHDDPLTYAQTHPDAAREIVFSYAKITPRVAERMKLSYWSNDLIWHGAGT